MSDPLFKAKLALTPYPTEFLKISEPENPSMVFFEIHEMYYLYKSHIV